MTPIRRVVLGFLAIALGGLSCDSTPPEPLNPFTDLEPLAFDGTRQPIASEISRLGTHRAGDVLEINVASDRSPSVYFLQPDGPRTTAAVIIGGGPTNEPLFHRVDRDTELFLFIDTPAGATVILKTGPPSFQPPQGQAFVIEFEDTFLADALFDPDVHGPDDRELLLSIEPVVRSGIVSQLRAIFADTPVTILLHDDPRPDEYSVITYSGRRVTESGPDAAVTPDTEEIVLLGEVLPSGQGADAGNHDPNDTAVVYVGSFRGTFATDAVNNIINPLAITGAHEAGHLLGLEHTALDGLMGRNLSFAFQRQLGFQRSQIVLDVGAGPEIFTNVIQDPHIYFDHIFGTAAARP